MSDREETKILPKVIVILGPTASGKTQLGIDLAKECNGEVISADSRQIYKKMNIGTAKVPGEWKIVDGARVYDVGGVPHHLVDFLDPGNTFTAAEFRDKALAHVQSIVKRGKLPFIIGGTGLYIWSLIDNLQIPRIPPNKKLRQSLEEKSKDELLKLLQSMDPEAALAIDPHNKRRIIRALEVCIFSGQPFSKQQVKGDDIVNAIQIGLDVPREVLYDRIHRRIDNMIEEGLVAEIEKILRQKYSWDLPSMSGIGYRQFKDFFSGKITIQDVVERLKRDTRHFARRQMTWFRRDKRIRWCRTKDEVVEHVTKFLSS